MKKKDYVSCVETATAFGVIRSVQLHETAWNISDKKVQQSRASCQGRDWMMMIFSLMQKR